MSYIVKVSKGAKIRNPYNQVPHQAYVICVNRVSVELLHQLTLEVKSNDDNVLTSLVAADFFSMESLSHLSHNQ